MKKILFLFLLLTSSYGCNPKVQIEPPSKPITINLNVKLEHEMKVQLSKDVGSVFKNNPELF